MPPTREPFPRSSGINPNRLTVMQRAFVDHLLADEKFSLTNAAKAAGYASPRTAGGILLKHPLVSKAIGKAIHDRSQRLKIDADRVLRELSLIGLSDPADLFDAGGNLKQIQDMPEGIRRAIQSIEVKEHVDDAGAVVRTHKVRLWSKVSALELLAKHLGMLSDRIPSEGGLSAETFGLLLKLIEGQRQQPIRVIDADVVTMPLSEKDTPRPA